MRNGGGVLHGYEGTLEYLFPTRNFTLTSGFLLISAIFILHNFWTNYRKKKWLTPHFKGILKLFGKNDVWSTHLSSFFCWYQHFYNTLQLWDQNMSRDVIMFDFHQNDRKCLSYQYHLVVQIWSHSHHFQRSYRNFSILPFYMEKYYIFTSNHHQHSKIAENV